MGFKKRSHLFFVVIFVGLVGIIAAHSEQTRRTNRIYSRSRFSADNPVVGLVEKMEQHSFISNSPNDSGKKINLGNRVYEGNVLKTPKSSKLHVRFKEGTYVELAQNSRFMIEKINFKPPNLLETNKAGDQYDEIVFRFFDGLVRIQAPEIHDHEHFIIKTRTAVIQARGPVDFFINTTPDSDDVEVKVRKGKLFILNMITNDRLEISDNKTADIKPSGLISKGGILTPDQDRLLINDVDIQLME